MPTFGSNGLEHAAALRAVGGAAELPRRLDLRVGGARGPDALQLGERNKKEAGLIERRQYLLPFSVLRAAVG